MVSATKIEASNNNQEQLPICPLSTTNEISDRFLAKILRFGRTGCLNQIRIKKEIGFTIF